MCWVARDQGHRFLTWQPSVQAKEHSFLAGGEVRCIPDTVVLSLGLYIPDSPHLRTQFRLSWESDFAVALCILSKRSSSEGCLSNHRKFCGRFVTSTHTHLHFLDQPGLSDGRRRRRDESLRCCCCACSQGQRLLCLQRAFPFNITRKRVGRHGWLSCFRAGVEEDPGVLPGRTLSGSSYSQAPVSGWRVQSRPPHAGASAGPSVHTSLCALPLGVLGSCWPGDDCTSRLLLVAQGQHQRKIPKDCTCREKGPNLYCLPLSW